MKLSELAKSCQEIIDTIESSHNEEKLKAAFEKIAKYIVFAGHFEIPGGLPIYPVDIEFYFHQEGDSTSLIKDPIMYHTYDHEKERLERYGLSENGNYWLYAGNQKNEAEVIVIRNFLLTSP